MPNSPNRRICVHCRQTFSGSGCLCPLCRPSDNRQSPAKRGYGRAWQKIRETVLSSAGIPSEQWPLYDVDHNPPYNPALEPDHLRDNLIPRLHADHSSKTAKEDQNRMGGAFARKQNGGRHGG